MLKGAIIGFGQVAEKAHVPAWKETKDFSIVAVADENPERARLAAQYFPGIHAYASLEELLQHEPLLDFVDIATPPFLHARQAVFSLQRHCHVLCEKPLALTMKDFESIRAQATSGDRVAFSAHNWKYSPIFLQAEQLIQAGAIGAVRHAEWHTLRHRPAANAGEHVWRTDPRMSGGGILVDHGWHGFYLLQALLRAEPRALTAHLRIPNFGGVEEEATCLLEYPGATAVLYLSWHAPYRSNWGILYGDEGTLELRDDRIHLLSKGGEPQIFEFAQKLSQGSAHPDWFGAMLEDFKTEILKPKLRRRNLREAETCLTLLMNIYQSHRLGGKTIPLPSTAGGLKHPENSRSAALQQKEDAGS